MAGLIEVVFEQISKNCVRALFYELVNDADCIFNIQCSEQLQSLDIEKLSDEVLQDFIEFNENISLLVNINTLRLGKQVLSNVQLRLIKYENKYDIDFNFNLDETENLTVSVKNLHLYIMKLVSDFDICNYYAGEEPASDEDSRYFTNERLGPLVT